MVIPGLVVGLLFFLPFIDARPDRRPLKRPLVTGGFGVIGLGIIVLTYLGYQDTPAHADPARWTPLAIAGKELAMDQRCVRCHRPGGAANPILETALRRDQEWLLSHARDPEVIAPGLRQPPSGGLGPAQAYSVVAYMKKVQAGIDPPAVPAEQRQASIVLGTYCATCHMIDGEGAASAPDLSHVGSTRDVKWLREWISSPESVDPFASMPPFGDVLNDQQMGAIVNYLAGRK
jgi:mono/diheme cytochrome c family protein